MMVVLLPLLPFQLALVDLQDLRLAFVVSILLLYVLFRHLLGYVYDELEFLLRLCMRLVG
jgi:hypothetical protein